MLPFKRMEFRKAQAKAIANRRLNLPPKLSSSEKSIPKNVFSAPAPPISVAKAPTPKAILKTASDYADEYRLLPSEEER